MVGTPPKSINLAGARRGAARIAWRKLPRTSPVPDCVTIDGAVSIRLPMARTRQPDDRN